MHKNTKLLPYQRREVYRRWLQGDAVTDLAREYRVSRKTLYEVFTKARLGVFENYSSKNCGIARSNTDSRDLQRSRKPSSKDSGNVHED